MKPQPLKGKKVYGEYPAARFTPKDVRSAVRFLKNTIQDSDIDEGETRLMMSLIDEAFEDVTR